MTVLKQIIRNMATLQQKKEIWTMLASNMLWQKYPSEILPTIENNMQWYKGGQINIAENCLSKNLQDIEQKNYPAIYYQNITTNKQGFVTYKQLNKRVLKFVDVLKSLGVTKGKRVLIYMPNIIETAEAILACSAIGAIFETQHYGVGMIQLKESLKTFNPYIIVTASCSIDQEGIHQNQFYINQARQDINRKDIKCLIIQRTEKKILELGNNDYDYSKIEIESPSKYIQYEKLDSNYPLYTFSTYLNINDNVIQNRVYRETGPFTVGLNYSMMKTLGIFKQSKLLCLAHISSTLGLSYMLFGPLLRGASTFFIEDPWAFSKNASQYIKNNNIQNIYIHSNLLQKIIKNNNQFFDQTNIQYMFLYGNIENNILDNLQNYNQQVNNFFFTKAFFNTELGVIAAADDWTKTNYNEDKTYATKVGHLEYKLRANKNDVDELCLKIDSYPGIFTKFFDQQTQIRFQQYYFKDSMYLNTFLPVQICNKNRLKILRRSEEDSPYKLISGVKFIKKQISKDIQQQIKQLNDFCFLPLFKEQEDDFIFFMELKDCSKVKLNQEEYNKLYKNVLNAISSSIGDVFNIENIFFFPQLPKIKSKGKIKIDLQRIRQLLDKCDKKIIDKDQEIFDFEQFEINIINNQIY